MVAGVVVLRTIDGVRLKDAAREVWLAELFGLSSGVNDEVEETEGAAEDDVDARDDVEEVDAREDESDDDEEVDAEDDKEVDEAMRVANVAEEDAMTVDDETVDDGAAELVAGGACPI